MGLGMFKGKGTVQFFDLKEDTGPQCFRREISDLLIKGQTGVITDFVGKNGKTFSAHLAYKDQLAFEFVNDKKDQ